MKKHLGRIAAIAGAAYAGLFLVFYFDLDGKFLYYVWEPMMIKRFDNMERKDMNLTPYLQTDDMSPAVVPADRSVSVGAGGGSKNKYGITVPKPQKVKITM